MEPLRPLRPLTVYARDDMGGVPLGILPPPSNYATSPGGRSFWRSCQCALVWDDADGTPAIGYVIPWHEGPLDCRMLMSVEPEPGVWVSVDDVAKRLPPEARRILLAATAGRPWIPFGEMKRWLGL